MRRRGRPPKEAPPSAEALDWIRSGFKTDLPELLTGRGPMPSWRSKPKVDYAAEARRLHAKLRRRAS
jgi:hypothetical protein